MPGIPMSIEVVKLQKSNEGFTIWIDEEQGFNTGDFLSLISCLKVNKVERVYQSFGPAQVIDEIHTELGIFNLDIEFDEYSGISIYSDELALMNKILDVMINSDKYHIRK